MEMISWTDRVRNVLYRVREEGNTICIVKMRNANWIGHILRRNYHLKHVIEGDIDEGIEVMARRGIRCKQLLDDLKKREDNGNWKRKH
jgi:hypothetical protein